MPHVVSHLSVADLEALYVASSDVRRGRHAQTIWLLAKGHTVAEVSELTAFGVRWIEQLLVRYNADGPDALGDLRRGNGAPARVLTPALLDRLRERLREPPVDDGVWTSPKVAAWMAVELGLERVSPQRGWDALQAVGWSLQVPRPHNPKAASPDEQAAYKKTRRRRGRGAGEEPRAAGRDLRH